MLSHPFTNMASYIWITALLATVGLCATDDVTTSILNDVTNGTEVPGTYRNSSVMTSFAENTSTGTPVTSTFTGQCKSFTDILTDV